MAERCLEAIGRRQIVPVPPCDKSLGESVSGDFSTLKAVRKEGLIQQELALGRLQPRNDRCAPSRLRLRKSLIDVPQHPRFGFFVPHATRQPNQRQGYISTDPILLGVVRQPVQQIEGLPVMADRLGASIKFASLLKRRL